jgi:hypothetical protein
MASDDMYAPESIDLLQKSGIDFQQHAEYGILPNDFAELMITSGLVLMPDTRWISFHRSGRGVVTCKPIPNERTCFVADMILDTSSNSSRPSLYQQQNMISSPSSIHGFRPYMTSSS